MKTSLTIGGLLLGGIAVYLGQMQATAIPSDGGAALAGPDVIVGAIPDVARYAPATYNTVEYASYAFGSTSCNIGTTQLQWQPNPSNLHPTIPQNMYRIKNGAIEQIGSTSCNIGTTQLQWQPNPSNLHPTIPQNMYRIKNGAIEQIGMSWCKHGFCALQQNLCGTCTPAGSGCPTVLGIGCSDPYTASLNGDQGDLKSRGPINPATGVFSGTYTDPTAPTGLPSSLRERVMVARNDLNPSLNAGAIYVTECQYIHPDDASSGNDNNNASYRLCTVGATWSATLGYPLTLSGATLQQQPAINAWKAAHADVTITPVDVVGDGRFLVGSRAIDNGNGTWRYEYAVQNLNSDRAGGRFSVPLPPGAVVTSASFKGPKYMNGEPYSNLDWTYTVSGGTITFQCEANTNVNANALRWATLYNFRFTCDKAPASGSVQLGLWKAPTTGSPATSMTVTASVPSGPPPIQGDFDGNGTVDAADLAFLLSAWGTPGADLNGDNGTDASDLAIVLSNWG